MIIPLAALLLGLLLAAPAESVSGGRVLLAASALLLFQGLLRDLWLLFSMKRSPTAATAKSAQCICLESTIGVVGILVGAVLFVSGVGGALNLNSLSVSLVALLIMLLGFALKDYVLGWNPWRIRRDQDHMNIIVSWKG